MDSHDSGEHGDTEALPVIRELSRDPAISAVWTEIDARERRIWLARGANGHPWLLAADSLARFREMIAGLSGYSADGAAAGK